MDSNVDSVITPECRKIINEIIMIPYNIEIIIIIQEPQIKTYKNEPIEYDNIEIINYNYDYPNIIKNIMKEYEEYDKSLQKIPTYLFKPTNNILKNGFLMIN
jgi:hypothetical protein